MAVYSRSDVAAISISPAHGGCGVTHVRPAPGGKPVPVWQLSCPKCEDFLRADPLWSPTSGTVPETPDEMQAREAAEGRTQREQLTNNVDALSRIGDALTILAQNHNSQSADTSQVIAMLTAVLAQHGVAVPTGATQAPDKGAPEAAIPEGFTEAQAELTDAQMAEFQDALNTMADDPAFARSRGGDAEPEGAASQHPDLDAMNMNALNDYAKSLGLPGRRSRAEQVEAIRAHLGL